MNLTAKVLFDKKQQEPTLFQKQGIISRDQILNREEFMTIMGPQIMKKWNYYLSILALIQKQIDIGNYNRAYQYWDKIIYGQMLQNSPVSIMLIDNVGVSKKGYTKNIYFNYDESQFITKQGQILDTSNALKKLEINQQLQEHLDSFLAQVNTKKITKQDAVEINIQYNSGIIPYEQVVQRAWASLSSKRKENSFRYVFYGSASYWAGQASDAFLQHLGKHHASLLNSLILNSNENASSITASVFQEEKQGIYKLLSDSKNKTSWYSGGDLFVRYKDFVFNIQLKTKRGSYKNGNITSVYYKIATANLLLLIKNLQSATTIQQITDALFDKKIGIETSGFIDNELAYSISEQINKIKNVLQQ